MSPHQFLTETTKGPPPPPRLLSSDLESSEFVPHHGSVDVEDDAMATGGVLASADAHHAAEEAGGTPKDILLTRCLEHVVTG